MRIRQIHRMNFAKAVEAPEAEEQAATFRGKARLTHELRLPLLARRGGRERSERTGWWFHFKKTESRYGFEPPPRPSGTPPGQEGQFVLPLRCRHLGILKWTRAVRISVGTSRIIALPPVGFFRRRPKNHCRLIGEGNFPTAENMGCGILCRPS